MTATRWFSLRHRLTLLLLGGVAACWLVAMAWAFVEMHHEVDELFDAQLAQSAQVLLAMAGRNSDDHGMEELDGHLDRYQRELMFQIWNEDDKLILRSANAPTTPLTDREGFSEAHGKPGHWRYFSARSRHRHDSVRVIVAENHDLREDVIRETMRAILAPVAIGLVLLGAWVWIATRKSLSPLDAVARQVGASAPERLQILQPETAPEEVRPLIEALNGLFRRVEDALENERRFTADAAHELRTPLAALAAQVHVATRARDEAERSHALAQLATGMVRASHLVDQLLTLARLEPGQDGAPTAQVRLDTLAEEVCADHGTQAIARNISLELDAAPTTVTADEELLRILLRNLVDNALRYTPAGGRVLVAVANAGGQATLKVTDSGPGIPASEREHVFERFARLAGQDIEGSGLGLSIVRRIAERHGAAIALGEGGGGKGLAFAVTFRK